MYAKLHEDSNIAGEFDFPTGDLPLQVNGRAIPAEPFHTDTGNYLFTRDQAAGTAVTIPVVVIDTDGWLVVYNNDQQTDPLGFTWLSAGINRNVSVEISSGQAGDMLYATLHSDGGTPQEFDYPEGSDLPLLRVRTPIGDLARVEVSGGLFWVDDLERERPRARAFEISATGPIFGTKVREPRGEIAALEAQVFERHGIPPASELVLPRGLRALGTRRPLRVLPRDLELTPLAEGGGFRLSCGLPPGAYVTVLLEYVVGSLGVIVDGSRASRSPDEAFDPGVSSSDAN
jgi:hypothetical protein